MLDCYIVARAINGDLTYEVHNGKKVVATGTSSSMSFVRYDAGGYHTKQKIDALYPDGWEVRFHF